MTVVQSLLGYLEVVVVISQHRFSASSDANLKEHRSVSNGSKVRWFVSRSISALSKKHQT